MSQRTEQQLSTIVGKNISLLRQKKGMSQYELAERVGIDSVSLSRIERGRVAPRFARLEKIAKSLGCSVARLFLTSEFETEIQEDVSRDAEILRLAERIATLVKERPKSSE